uniref:TBC domain-containing protein n=1 Tax=Trepomonas sp. PC1 TaxID=1076344 RepID=A0A146K8A2_9EUKA|eukprot:JAP91771.1 TBC domain-containing protein [Trepomonas sp. PC1]
MNLIRDQFAPQVQCDTYASFTKKEEFSTQDFEQLMALSMDKGIPCLYKTTLWAQRASLQFGQEAQDFLDFICNPGFDKYLSGEHINIKALSKQQVDDELPIFTEAQELPLPEKRQLRCIYFVRRNKLIFNDINRTLSKTALFCDNQPLFKPLCELVTCVTVRYQSYMQGLSVLCATCLLYSQSTQNGLALILKLTQTKIYLRFLSMNTEILNTYSSQIYKTVLSLLKQKEFQGEFKFKFLMDEELLQQNIYPTMCGSAVGLVLSCFGKCGVKLAVKFVDICCFGDQRAIDLRFFQTLVAFYCAKFKKHYTPEFDVLLSEITKQKEVTEAEAEEIVSIIKFIEGSQIVKNALKTIEEVAKYV